MTHLYDARGPFEPLRPKNKVKLPTQSAEKWICMGKGAFENLGIFFSKKEGPRRLDLSILVRTLLYF